MKRDLHHILQSGAGDTAVGAAVILAPIAAETAIEGTECDLRGYRSAEIVINVGAFTTTATEATMTILESDSSATSFTTVAAADLRGGANSIVISSTATASKVYLRGYVGNSRYLRVDVAASATAGYIVGIVCLRGHRMNKGKLNETA